MEKSLSLNQAAVELHVQARTLRLWIKEGRLPAIKVGKRWLVLQTTIDQILKGEISMNGSKKKS